MKIDDLVRERNALAREWQTNYAARIEIQHKLDRLTTALAKATNMPLLADLPSFDPFGFGGGRRRSRKKDL